MNLVISKCEKAVANQLSLTSNGAVPIYVSDVDGVKDPMPYIVIHGNSYEEQIGPGSGIFKIRMDCVFRSHVKGLGSAPDEARDAAVTWINNFLYSDPKSALSASTGFHCYGFVPVSGEMRVQGDYKAYEYHTQFDVFCMPRDNE